MTAPSRSVRTFRAEREFGLLVGGVLAALGGWWIYREKFPGLRLPFLAVGALLVVLGALAPRALRWPYRLWMGGAEWLSRIVTTLVLSIVFFLVVTPIGVFKRLGGWDPLERRAVPAGSYWRPSSSRHRDPRHFDRMY